ncbi:MAG: hypothetical protein AB1626_02315 [Candidatus Micrarchaeota archaeon]
MLSELAAFLFSIALLAGVYWFFRAFKDSSLAKALVIIDLGLLAFATHNGFELFNALNQSCGGEYSLYSDAAQIMAYVLLLAGFGMAWKGFKSFNWLKELGRQ